MNIRSLVAAGWLLLAWSAQAWAQERGTTGADFLKIGLGAAAAGSGEAWTARTGDMNAMFYNPAGLAGIDLNRLAAMHLNWIADTQYEALAYVRPLLGVGTIGTSVFLLHMPDIPARDENNLDVGALRVYDLGMQFSFARELGTWLGIPGLAGGANLKLLHRQLAGVQASGAACDLGATYVLSTALTLGLSILNAGYLSTFESGSDSLPLTLRGGACWAQNLAADHGLTLALDLVQAGDSSLRANAGLEYSFRKLIFLRAGYKIGYDLGELQAGAGVSWQNLNLDYAVKPMGVFGLTHLISASLGFGMSVKSQQENQARLLLEQAEALFQKSQYPQALETANQAAALDPGNERALQLRDKLRTVLEMLNLQPDGAAGSTDAGNSPKTLTPDEKEESGSPAGEAKP